MTSRRAKPLFALCTISLREKLLEYALEVAAELGVEGVEIWGREPHISEKYDENRVQAARRMVEERGLVPAVLGSYLGFGLVRNRGEEAVELEDVLHTAHCLRTPLVQVWASDVASDQASKAVWDRTVAEAQEACDRAARLHLTLTAQMGDDTLADTPDSCRRLLDRVGRENFRLTFQVSARPRPETPEERLTAVLDSVAHLHLQNYEAYCPNGERVRRASLADGVVDYFPLLERLVGGGYTGYYALAFASREGEGKRQALAQDLSYLKSQFKLMGLKV